MARQKQQKPYWEQFDLTYAGRPGAQRRWKWTVTVLAIAASTGWIAFALVGGESQVFSSGKMSAAHAQWANRCDVCHTQAWDALKGVLHPEHSDRNRNAACLDCHGAAIAFDVHTQSARHQSLAGSEPLQACDLCHTEHQGMDLVEVGDRTCISCHRDLSHLTGNSRITRTITDLTHDHPDVLWAETDPGTLKFNHDLHLQPELRGLEPRQRLNCADCHVPEAGGGRMRPIQYQTHCRACHELTVDGESQARWPGGAVPHVAPADIEVYLRGRLAEYVRQHDEWQAEDPEEESLRPTRRPGAAKDLDRRSLVWIDRQIDLYREKIFKAKKTCLKCHEQTWTDGAALPGIVDPNMPGRWMHHAEFNHDRHRTWGCLECHASVTESEHTADVNLPRIDSCRTCHGSSATAGGRSGASSTCVTCHTYHHPAPPPRVVMEGTR